MDIRITEGQYKSLKALAWTGIPEFAVITGGNGSGKTQLLELIARAAGIILPPEGTFNIRGQQPEQSTVAWECSEPLNGQNTVFLRSFWDIADAQSSTQNVRAEAEQAWQARPLPSPLHQRDKTWDLLWATLERKARTSRNDIDRETFDRLLPPNFMLLKSGAANPSFLYATIPNLFLSYALRAYYVELAGGMSEDFAREFGEPPWLAANRVLRSAGLRYEAIPPTISPPSWTQVFDGNYRLQLRNLESGAVITPNALSAGERVIFLAAIWSYFFNQSELTSSTALLLLDEPDAHLHPALTSVFLKVIRDELVGRRGIRVIMTTHSPSTVALTEDNELFVMSSTEPRIQAVTDKWAAVARLTAGLVTVGSHTKAVFVEDKDDAAFYRAAQAVLINKRPTDIRFDPARALTFIAASDGRGGGGKNMVNGWVTSIESTQVYGIVDKDEDPAPRGRVLIGERRHLETYLLDPLFIYALVLDENRQDRPNFAPGVDSRHSRSLLELHPDILQGICNGVANFYRGHLDVVDGSTVAVSYVGGPTLQLPAWLLTVDMKKLINEVRLAWHLQVSTDALIRKYEAVAIMPTDLARVFSHIQNA